MKAIELLGIEAFILLGLAIFVLHWLSQRKKRLPTEKATFVGGPLDGQVKNLRSLEPTYVYKVERNKYAVYLHSNNDYGKYAFDDFVKQP